MAEAPLPLPAHRGRPNSDTGGEFHLPASHGVMRKSVPTEKRPTTAPGCPRTPQPHVAPPTADCLDPRREETGPNRVLGDGVPG